MKKLLKRPESPRYSRVLGIDPSSVKIAAAVIEAGEMKATVTIPIKGQDIYEKILVVRTNYASILSAYKPQFVCVEQTISLQNPMVSRKLSYLVGIIIAETLYREIPIIDVPPMTWKSRIGVKPIYKAQKQDIILKLGETAGRKEVQRLKKSQTQEIMSMMYPHFSWVDDDLADAAGIATYAWSEYGESE